MTSIAQVETPRNEAPQILTAETFARIMENVGAPGFVPPVTWFTMGRKALRLGRTPVAGWPFDMAEGWYFEGSRCYVGLETRYGSTFKHNRSLADIVRVGADG